MAENIAKRSGGSSIRTNTSTKKSVSKVEVVNVADLEKVINNLIDIKLQEKTSLANTSSPKLMSAVSPSKEEEEDKTRELIETPISLINRRSLSINSKSSRFRSPEASNRIPATSLNRNRSSRKEINDEIKNKSLTPPLPPLHIPTVPSVINLKNNEKYPSVNKSDTASLASTKVLSKIKSLLNKVGGNTSKSEDQLNSIGASPNLFCNTNNNRKFVNLCLGSNLNDNSEMDINRRPQSSPNSKNKIQKILDEEKAFTSDDSSSSYQSKIIPIKAPKFTASPPQVKNQVSLFCELQKELENIERNSSLGSLKPPPPIQQQKNEVIYQLEDDNIYFKETTLLTNDESTLSNNNCDDEHYYTANSSSVIYSWDAYETDKIENDLLNKTITIKINDVSSEIQSLSTSELRKRIEAFGDRPGPVTETTRKIYELRLMQLEKSGPLVEKLNNEFNVKNKGFSIELINDLNSKIDTIINDKIEGLMSICFDNGNNGNWREGHLKASFNYLLIDPRVSENLPARAKYLGLLF
jgi:hypothetical protein